MFPLPGEGLARNRTLIFLPSYLKTMVSLTVPDRPSAQPTPKGRGMTGRSLLALRSETRRARVAEVKGVVFEIRRLHLQRQVIDAETIV